MITNNQLQALLLDLESDRVERTVSTNNTDKFCEAVCAFANDIGNHQQPGYLIIGANDNGELNGLKVTDELLLNLSSIRSDGNVLPQPALSVHKFSFNEGDIAVVEVQPSVLTPVRYKGKIWIRIGPRKAVANESEERILIEKRISQAGTFDALPCLEATIDDIKIDLFSSFYLPKAVDIDVLKSEKRSIEQQLASLRFFDLRYNCPTYAAIILFGKNPEYFLPGAYTQFVKFEGNTMATEIRNQYKFSGNLCELLPKLDGFIDTSVVVRLPVPVSVLKEKNVLNYPYWAIRELLMNAIMHRNYQTNTPAKFYEFNTHLIIENPGNLYGNARPENFPNVSDYRNPIIAEAMKILGYVNRFNRGIIRVEQELTENKNGKAQFDISKLTMFSVLVLLSTDFEQLVTIENTDSEQKLVVNTNKGTNKGTSKGTNKGTSKGTNKGTSKGTNKESNKNENKLSEYLEVAILNYCLTAKKMTEILEFFNYSNRTKFRSKFINKLINEELLIVTYSDNVHHRNQSYFTSEKGKTVIDLTKSDPKSDPQSDPQSNPKSDPQSGPQSDILNARDKFIILSFCLDSKSANAISQKFRIKDKSYFRNKYILPLLQQGLLAMTIPDKPNSRLQKYRTTAIGEEFLKKPRFYNK